MYPTPRRLAAAIAALTLLLAACGGDDARDSGSRDGEVETSEQHDDGAGGGTADADEPSDTERAGSPLEQLFGSMGDSQRFVEDGVAACMRERGWEYEPNTGAMVMAMTAGPGRDPAFVEQYGYGISTRPPADEMFGGRPDEGFDDPNAEYLESLSEADRDRYYSDLMGASPMRFDEASGGGGGVMIETDDIDLDTCFAQAQRAAAEEHPELSEAFGERLMELMQGIDDDPAMVAAMEAWSTCMAAADYPYESQREVFDDLLQRYTQITGDDPSAPGADGDSVVISSGAMLDGEELDLSPVDEERLAKLQADEIAIAQHDRACAEEHIDDVRRELEEAAADELRSEYPGLGTGE